MNCLRIKHSSYFDTTFLVNAQNVWVYNAFTIPILILVTDAEICTRETKYTIVQLVPKSSLRSFANPGKTLVESTGC